MNLRIGIHVASTFIHSWLTGQVWTRPSQAPECCYDHTRLEGTGLLFQLFVPSMSETPGSVKVTHVRYRCSAGPRSWNSRCPTCLLPLPLCGDPIFQPECKLASGERSVWRHHGSENSFHSTSHLTDDLSLKFWTGNSRLGTIVL